MTDNLDILLKLFDTLKASSDKNEEATNHLIRQQIDLMNHIKNLSLKDIKQLLQEHAKESESDINSCTKNVTELGTDLATVLDKINNRISKMILVVIVAFSLLTGSYLFIRSVVDTNLKYEKWQEKIEEVEKKEFKKIKDELKTMIEERIDDIKK